MLRFEASGRAGTLGLTLAAEAWCPAMLPELAGLAWSELVDAQTLDCWLPEQPLLQFAGDPLGDTRVRLREVVPVSVLALGDGPQPCLRTVQGTAWIEHIDASPTAALSPTVRALRVSVELGIARLRLPLHRLRSLAPGAVLLIDQLEPVARTARHRLYAFDFTLETISVNTTFDFLDDEDDTDDFAPVPAPAAATPPPATNGIDIRRLPVTVDVVLCQLQQPIGELDALQPGTVFNLPPDAWTHLQLRVNGQTIARGELVQVGDQLGVQLAQAPVLP